MTPWKFNATVVIGTVAFSVFVFLWFGGQRLSVRVLLTLITLVAVGSVVYATLWVATPMPAPAAFAYVVPQTASGLQELPLAVVNAGSEPLDGVTVTIRNTRDFVNPKAFFGPRTITVGVLAPNDLRLLGPDAFITPQLDAQGVDLYHIDISARNGPVTQMLDVRKNKYQQGRWAYRYDVVRNTFARDDVANATTTTQSLPSEHTVVR